MDFNKKVFIQGILNITPDSFSDGGKFNTLEKALKQANSLCEEGAQIIDIGAESTRPNAKLISVEEEQKRFQSIFTSLIKELKKTFPQIIISVDTRKPLIANIALNEGAHIINDVSACEEGFNSVAPIVAKFPNAFLVLNHHFGLPPSAELNQTRPDIIELLTDFLSERIELVCSMGVKKEQLILDPGLGFGKNTEENLLIIENIPELKQQFSLPILISASRKRFIKELSVKNNTHQDIESANIAKKAVALGVNIVRCHNVDAHAKALH